MFLLGNVQSGSKSHPVFWSMGTGVLSLGVERLVVQLTIHWHLVGVERFLHSSNTPSCGYTVTTLRVTVLGLITLDSTRTLQVMWLIIMHIYLTLRCFIIHKFKCFLMAVFSSSSLSLSGMIVRIN
jgi:hypothetical protein